MVSSMTAACAPQDCDTCPGKIICRCLQVTEEHLVEIIARYDLRTIRDIRKHTGAGDGCTCCHEELQQHLDRHALAVIG